MRFISKEVGVETTEKNGGIIGPLESDGRGDANSECGHMSIFRGNSRSESHTVDTDDTESTATVTCVTCDCDSRHTLVTRPSRYRSQNTTESCSKYVCVPSPNPSSFHIIVHMYIPHFGDINPFFITTPLTKCAASVPLAHASALLPCTLFFPFATKTALKVVRCSPYMLNMIEKLFGRRTKLMFDPGLLPQLHTFMRFRVCLGMIQIQRISPTSAADSAGTQTT